MKRLIVFIFILLITPFILHSPVSASGLSNPLKFDTVWGLLAAFLPIVAIVIGISLIGYLMYGAYLWMSSADKPDQLAAAQKTLVNAVIGFALFGVMLGLFFFLSYILDINWSTLVSTP